MSNISSLVKKLTDIRSNDTVSVYIPSTGKTETFLPISAKQQKDLLKYTLNAQNDTVGLIREINNIILENCTTENNDFFLIDRYAIIVELRKVSFGNIVKTNDKEFNLDDIKIEDLAKSIKTTWNEYNFKGKGIEVECYCPTLRQENKILDKISSDLKKLPPDKTAADVITLMYSAEICKFITQISIDSESINFDDISYGDRKLIIDNLPVTINQKVLNYIQKVREIENSFITIDNQIMPIEALFFTTE